MPIPYIETSEAYQEQFNSNNNLVVLYSAEWEQSSKQIVSIFS